MADTSLRFPTVDEIRNQILADYLYGFSKVGIKANVKRGSELYIRADVFARRVSVAIANGRLAYQQVNPLRATGQKLIDLAAMFGVYKRGAGAASGFVICKLLPPATSVLVTAGYAGTGSANGVQYAVVADTTTANLGSVRIQAQTTGTNGNLGAGAIVTWNSAAIGFLDQKTTVDAAGIDGGTNADSEDVLRARLLKRLGFPAVGGNWAHVESLAEGSSAAIVDAFVYPTARGPGSYDVAIVGTLSAQVLNSTVQSQALAAITAQLPGTISLNVTSVAQQKIDVVVNLGAPLPKLAGGAGGGWVDSAPWPSTNEPTLCGKITSHSTASIPATITVNSTNADAPVAGQRIAIWDYASKDASGNATPQFRFFNITAIGGGSGAYVLTLDASATSPNATTASFIEDGMYVSPAADRLQQYADAILAAIAQLGPGEKTADTDLLVYARRKPGPDIASPYNLTSRQLDVLTKGFPGTTALQFGGRDVVLTGFSEVTDASFAGRLDTGAGTTRTGPSAPSLPSSPPNILSVKYFAFRRQT